MAAKGVYVYLNMGVERATLPDNRTMKPNCVYLISLDDFQKLSRSVRDSVISTYGIETNSAVVTRASETGYQFISLAGYSNGNDNDIAAMGWKSGQVIQGLNGEAFKLCPVGPGNVETGDAVSYDNDQMQVKAGLFNDRFAGVAVGNASAGNYVWVQTEGVVSEAKSETGVSAGNPVKPTEDGTFDVASAGESVGTALSSGSGGTIELALRSTRARNRYVKRPNIFYPGQ